MVCHNSGGQMSCQKGWFLVDALRGNPFHMSFLASGVEIPGLWFFRLNLWSIPLEISLGPLRCNSCKIADLNPLPQCPLAYRYVTQSLSSSSHHLLCAVSPSLLRTLVIGLRIHSNLSWSCLKILLFQMKSHLQVLDERIFWGEPPFNPLHKIRLMGALCRIYCIIQVCVIMLNHFILSGLIQPQTIEICLNANSSFQVIHWPC